MIKTKVIDMLGRAALVAAALAVFWFWSNHQVEKRVKAECALQHSNQQILVMEKHQKEAENVENKKADIYSKPNAGRNSLLNKMRAGQL